jgi:3-phenylpropionate/trans-cinnamate dioxygenase ferredoxin reductase subunit
MPEPVFVIVGASLAGAKAAETLRDEGFGGRIVLIGEEADRPYERPPLSKGYLLGRDERDTIFVHEEGWYTEHDVDLRLGVRATAIDPKARRVELAGGSEVGYDKLLITTGASPRRLDVPGHDLGNVLYLRTVQDAQRLSAAFRAGGHVVIAGAGWIGLEAAAAAREYGCEVTVVEPAPGSLHASLGPELGGMFTELHRSHGVTFRFGEGVSELRGAGGQVTTVVTSTGAELPADTVVVGIGAVPNSSLAEAAGLEVGNGIAADASLRTSAPDIYAAGDVVNSFHPMLGQRVRVEHWGNALIGGPAAAKAMLGQDVTYDPVPYFYSDQFDLGMEAAGLPGPGRYDQVIYRGDRDGLEFIAFWLSAGVVVAGMNVNVWDVNDDIQALIRAGAAGQHADQAALADPDVPLTSLTGP